MKTKLDRKPRKVNPKYLAWMERSRRAAKSEAARRARGTANKRVR